MALLWIKQWLDSLGDPKLIRLSLAERGAWWSLLLLAGICDADGKLISGDMALTMDDLADALHIKAPEDRAALESMVNKMKEYKSIGENGHTLSIVNWKKRQRTAPSALPEAVAERVRLHRARQNKMKDEEQKEQANAQRALVFEGLKSRRGYNSPVADTEAKAITWMFKQGYTADDMLAAYDQMKAQPFWQEKALNMMSVKSQIGELVKQKKATSPEAVAKAWKKKPKVE